jgi:hypothetical protein
MTETRYQRQKRADAARQRHARIVGKLSRPIEEEWDEAMEESRPNCRKSPIPSRWTDWDSNPDHREPYESDMPTAEEARKMCEGCPILSDRLCGRYAEATGQSHGVWNGRRRENGKWVS